ncbi:xanthine dehydrogenase family protein molybdopterin-binding subunit [Niallia taxi]|uniref:xanthine dehydrogenase family protein molybdopterin-binding subunit n=1 Tax=Niallia taxi TaxID=2499688 RepID=UPI002E22CB8D|nr:xanthine dehydrogenase family protein molybdopterin-binding subunit [Niallia taxi]MED4119843.1 xanthine dehydrogenase family protein molybdopterin-binding subunit [Niallia taxi]
MHIIGKSVVRKESKSKVTGYAHYTADTTTGEALFVRLVKSKHAHANILRIDETKALQHKGVRAVVLGKGLPYVGEEVRDRPPIAHTKVRYIGEIVALIVADSNDAAQTAEELLAIEYEVLPVVNSPIQAMQKDAPLLHERINEYAKDPGIYPITGTNIINKTKIRKGNMEKGWSESAVIMDAAFFLPIADHTAMETRSATCEIMPDGEVLITTSSQAPYMVKKILSRDFHIPTGKIIVKTPFVGGGYGGKASVQLEIFAYLASKAVGGRLVKIVNTREDDLLVSPVHIGLHANVKLGCSSDGKLTAAELEYIFDGGAYADKSPHLTTAGAVDCTGPYKLENLFCDSLCVYTNHPYAAPFRGFSHGEVHFAFERTMDMMAKKLNMDPLHFRQINAIHPGDQTPTRVVLNKSNVGNVEACINKLRPLFDWEKGMVKRIGEHVLRVKGVSCSWKNSTIGPDAGSGVVLTFNSDGSINLMSGLVEIGTGTKTVLAQILAEKLKMDIKDIHVRMTVDTQTEPEHWKTVASRGTLMAGRAVLAAADDAINQIKSLGSTVMRVPVDDLEVGYKRVYLRDDPATFLPFKEIVYGYVYPNGTAIGGQIVARGKYILRGLTNLDPETGEGNPGPEWAVGAHGIEVDYNTKDFTYRIRKAITVMDIGEILNYKAAVGQVKGAMSMGLSWAAREGFYFDENGKVLNHQLRTYRPIRFGEHPEYIADFVKTPHLEAPYGARGAGEHGLIGIPAALANALSLAAEVELTRLPLIPEEIWRSKKELDKHDL